jgi:predicted transposase/invertase (TIGR01784 family)
MLLDSDQVHCLYLDELEEFDTLPLGLALIKLTVVSEAELIPLSAQLIQKAKQQSKPFPPLPDIIEIVTTVAVYKLTALSREEIEAMLDLEIKETRVYQEIKEEGREEGREEGQMAMAILIAKDLLKTTMSLENVATLTRLELSKVIALQQESDSNASDSNADDIETGDSDKVET